LLQAEHGGQGEIDYLITFYIHMQVLSTKKTEGKECRMSGIASSLSGMMSAMGCGNVDGNVGGSRTDDKWQHD
jgi:hypothetical protein